MAVILVVFDALGMSKHVVHVEEGEGCVCGVNSLNEWIMTLDTPFPILFNAIHIAPALYRLRNTIGGAALQPRPIFPSLSIKKVGQN